GAAASGSRERPLDGRAAPGGWSADRAPSCVAGLNAARGRLARHPRGGRVRGPTGSGPAPGGYRDNPGPHRAAGRVRALREPGSRGRRQGAAALRRFFGRDLVRGVPQLPAVGGGPDELGVSGGGREAAVHGTAGAGTTSAAARSAVRRRTVSCGY